MRKDSMIISNSVINNKKSNKDSSMIDSSSMQVCHIEKNFEKIESSGPILKLLMQKQENNVDDTKNDDKNNSTKITKILNIKLL